MTYIILQLILNSVTGEPISVSAYQPDAAPYTSYEDCERAKADIGPQTPVDGLVKVFTCATEKKITQL